MRRHRSHATTAGWLGWRAWTRRLSSIVLALLCVLPLSGAAAQEPESEETAGNSPRATFEAFLENARRGRYRDASVWLDIPKEQLGDEAELARKLRTVLDRQLWIEPAALSPRAEGNLDDGLPSRQEELGRILGPSGRREPVLLIKTSSERNAPWRFSRGTVLRIEGWYDALPEHLLLDRMPRVLLRVGPLDLMWWQWLFVPVLAAVSALAGRVVGWLLRQVLMRIIRSARWNEALIQRSRGPLWLLGAIGVAYALIPRLALLTSAETLIHTFLKSGVILALFWAALRSIDLAADVLSSFEVLRSDSARALLPLGTRFAKVAVVLMLVIAVLSNFGLPVASLLAGLGVGGIAVALAAQKTVENLFGAVALGLDRPFRVGDLVKVDELIGVVEAVGLRSTRIRTPDRSVITLPNAKLADSRIESLSARDRLRVRVVLNLEYGTSESKVRAALDGIENALHAHTRVVHDDVSVRLIELGAYALNVEVVFWLTSRDKEFTLDRQELLLSLLAAIERAGAKVALPTQEIRMNRAEDSLTRAAARFEDART